MVCDYRIGNTTSAERHFMWKLHVALAVGPGDRITRPAATARVADSVWSRCRSIEPFAWPNAGVLDVSLVPDDDGTTEFVYLYDLAEGRMGMRTVDGASIECRFDTDVFPCCCYFASYGGMHGAVTSVLEPCTTMPVSVNDAAANGFCSRLEPGEELVTTVTWTIDERSTGSE